MRFICPGETIDGPLWSYQCTDFEKNNTQAYSKSSKSSKTSSSGKSEKGKSSSRRRNLQRSEFEFTPSFNEGIHDRNGKGKEDLTTKSKTTQKTSQKTSKKASIKNNHSIIILPEELCQSQSSIMPGPQRCYPTSIPVLNPTTQPNSMITNSPIGTAPPAADTANPSRETSQSPNILLGSICGRVTEDIDNNNSGDMAIPSVTINLIDSRGGVVASVLTDSDGKYCFYDLPIGKYVVTETNLDGFTDVSDIDGPPLNSIAVDLATKSNSTGNDFVDERLRQIIGQVLEDTNNDNRGDKPLVGVNVTLFLPNGTAIATVLTDSNGNFTFLVPPGVYIVRETNPPGYVDVSDSDGGDLNSITVDVSRGNDLDNVFVDKVSSSSSSVPTVSNMPGLLPSVSPASVQLGSICGKVQEDIDNTTTRVDQIDCHTWYSSVTGVVVVDILLYFSANGSKLHGGW